MIGLVLALAAAWAQATAGKASVPDPLPQVARPVQTAAEVATSRRAMASMMRCVVDRAAYKVRKVLDLTVGGSGPQAPWAKLADVDCLEGGGTLRFAPNLMRGDIYVALYAHDFGKAAPIADFASEPVIKYPVDLIDSDEDAVRYRVSMSIADCAVRKDPLDARNVVSTEIATDGERAAIRAFAPALSGCLEAGNTIKMNVEVIKGLTAEALYRLSIAKRDNSHANS